MGALAVVRKKLILPDNVLDATDHYEPRSDVDYAIDFRRYLKQIDSRLDLIWVKAGSEVFPRSPRWYIVRHNEHAPDSYWVIEDEHDEYSEPTERHLDRLREYDTAAHPDVWRKFEKSRVDAKLRADKALEDKSEEFRTRLGERLDHIFDSRIAVTDTMKEVLDSGGKAKRPPPPPRKRRRSYKKDRV